ncbi:hypothetical protein MHI57_24715 [Cytobacillus sp. FSL K6-0129]|uniref:hypothetical protein n=1 Tax=Cytobacillus sp. FSL K6-0129 TaxID=2921421 RepID=UPI0030F92EEB
MYNLAPAYRKLLVINEAELKDIDHQLEKLLDKLIDFYDRREQVVKSVAELKEILKDLGAEEC